MRGAVAAGLVAAMLAFGVGVYEGAGFLRGNHRVVHRPNEISAPSLPGTMYVAQAGAIYRFQHGSFTAITSENGWMQPSAAPNDQLVAVRRQTKYSIDNSFQVHSQLWIQRRAGSSGVALTTPEAGCGQPAISPDEKLIAMVCTRGSSQSAELDVATFDATNLALGSPATLVSGRMVASPAFSPDGKTIAFLAPDNPGGHFQLWTVGSSGPASVREITSDLGLDSTSAPVWMKG